MKPNLSNRRKWWRELGWLGGAEGAAIFAVILAIPFLIQRFGAARREADGFDQTQAADLFSATVETTIATNVKRAFAVIAPIEVATIMTGYGLLPAVGGVENQSGDWDSIGQTRRVRLTDGTSADEELTAFEAPHHFAYTVSNFTGALRFLAHSARGDWRFNETADGQTRVVWRYSFRPASVWASLPLILVTRFLWRGYMKRALGECARQASSGLAQ